MEDEDIHLRGQEAEQFLRMIGEGSGYFFRVMEEVERELKDRLLSLRPTDREEFSILKAQLDGLMDPFHRVYADIEAGRAAWGRISGTAPEGGGIL